MKRMLSAPEIYLYRESVDFRKSINGLAAMIESDTDLPLGSGALFLFTNKQRDKALSRRALRQKACLPTSSLANTSTRCHCIVKSRCLLSRISSYHGLLWQGWLSKSVRSSPRFMQP